jgi:predicted anti-sigma-YlaC factor YlaD
MRPAPPLVCDRVRAQISLALDGELSQLEHAMLSSHLTRCADCRVYEADVTGFTQRVRETPLEPLSRPVVVSRSRRRISISRLQVGAAAALAVAALLGTGELLKGKQLEIQQIYVPSGKTQIKYPTRQQVEREQAILERARPGNPVQLEGHVL